MLKAKDLRALPPIKSEFARPGAHRTPAYETLEMNIGRIDDLFALVVEETLRQSVRVAQYQRKPLPNTRRGLSVRKAGIGRLKAASERLDAQMVLAVELSIVLLVTFTEAYLQDVLAHAASLIPDLMAESDQKIAYGELEGFISVDEVSSELRFRWARNFVDKGGPKIWSERFARMGSANLEAKVTASMEEAWGVRHVLVHRAGVASRDFCNRHRTFGATPGKRIDVRARSGEYTRAVASFATIVDDFFVARIASKGAAENPK